MDVRFVVSQSRDMIEIVEHGTSTFLIKEYHCFAKCFKIFMKFGTEATNLGGCT